MKIILSIAMLILALFIPTAADAFNVVQVSNGGIDLSTYFKNFVTLVGALPIAVEFIKYTVKVKGITLQIISWSIGLILSLLAWHFKLGMFENITEIWHVLLIGLLAALASNGIADIKLLRAILSLFGIDTSK